MKHHYLLILLILMLNSCTMSFRMHPDTEATAPTWQQQLTTLMPQLGHRNWIVITDMAYPLQSGEGIITIVADEPYEQVLATVKQHIDDAPHVFAHIWRDAELAHIPDADVPGIDDLRSQLTAICGEEAQSMPHEQLIARLDEAGKLYTVIIIKTPLLVPYTTTFFELDCAYWDAARQQRLNEKMQQD